MNLQELLNELTKNPNISIAYTNINGNETLKINGEEVSLDEEEIDHKEDDEVIEDFKNKWELIDDCTFEMINNEVSKTYNLNLANQLLDKENKTEEEYQASFRFIQFFTNKAKEIFQKRINEFKLLSEKF